MHEARVIKVAQRGIITCTAVGGCLGVWYVLFSISLSYPIGAQDYGFPITFRRVYAADIVLFFPHALMFDAAMAALVVIAIAYSFWHWSTSWSTGFCAAFVLVLSGCVWSYLNGDSIPSPLLMLYFIVLVVAVPITWLSSVAYVSAIAGRHFFGSNRALLLPLLLTVVVSGMGWRCWPEDIFRSDRNPSSIRALVERLSDDNPHVRSLAVTALRHLGPYDESTTSAIIVAMSDPDAQVQSNAISLASELGPAAVKAVPILRDKFNQDGGCTFELAQLGPIAKEAVPDLKEKLHGSQGYSKLGICNALWKIDGNATLVVSSLIELLDDKYGPIRRDAAASLGEIGPEAADAIPMLRAMVSHVPKADMPAPADVASPFPVLREMTEAEFYPQIRSAAQVALSKIGRSE